MAPLQTDGARKPSGSYIGYLLYCIILFIPMAHVSFGYHTLFAIEFRRFILSAALLIGGGLFLVMQRVYWKRKLSLHQPMLVLFGAMLIASVFSQNRPLSLETSLQFLVGGLLYYLATYHVRPQLDLPRLRGAIALATAMVALYSLAQHLGRNPLELVSEGERQLSATFVTRNLLAAYLLFGLIFQIDGVLRETRRTQIACYVMAALISGAALALSLTVSAWGACAVGLAGYFWFVRRLDGFVMTRVKLLIVPLVIAMALVGAIELRKPAEARRAYRAKFSQLASGESKSVRERVVMWKIAGRIFLDNMVLGSGPGTYSVVRDRYAGRYLAQPRYRDLEGLSTWAHNDVLQIASETGAAGLIPLLALLAAGCWLPFALMRKNDVTRLHLARTLPFWAGWLGLTCHAMFHYTLYAPAAAFYWWLSLGLVAGVDLRVVKKPALEKGLRRISLKLVLLGAALIAPLYLASQFVARYAQARGFRLGNDGKLLLEEGKPREAHQKFKAARSDYRLCASLRPWAGTMWAQLGTIERRSNRLKRAHEAYQGALYWQPYDAVVHHKIGLLYLQQGLLDPADHYARRAVELRPNLAPALCLRGLVARRRDRKEQALEFFEQAREADPSDPGGYHWGALTLIELGRLTQVDTLLRLGMGKIRKSMGSMLLTTHLLAMRAMAMGQPQEALRLWQAASRAYGGLRFDTFEALARGDIRRRRAYMKTETIHELAGLTQQLLLNLRRDLPRPLAKRLGSRLKAFRGFLLATLEAQLAEQPADSLGVRALESLDQIDRLLRRARQQAGERDMTATRYARAQIPGIRQALQQGPLFQHAKLDQPRILSVLHRLRSLDRAGRKKLDLRTPLYLAELRLLRKLLAPGSDLDRTPERLLDDLFFLEADALTQAGQLEAAERVYQRLIAGNDEDRATLLPPWAAPHYAEAPPAAIKYFEDNRPLAIDQARLKLAELTLLKKQPRLAAQQALALFERIGKLGRLSLEPLPVALRESKLAQGALLNAIDRRALDLATLAWLMAGDLEAARNNEHGIKGHFADRAARVARNLELLKTAKGSDKLRQALLRDFASF